MVRSPQLIVCAEVTAGSCAEAAVHGVGLPDCRQRAVQVDLGAAHRPLAVVQGLQSDQVPAERWWAEIAAADPGAVVAQILQVEQERRALVVGDGLQPAVGEHVEMRAAAVADDDLVLAILLSVDG